MKLSSTLLFVFLFAVTCQPAKKEANTGQDTIVQSPIPILTKIWETDTLLSTVESVIYDSKRQVLYATNINQVPPTAKDNDGFISILSLDGDIINLHWVKDISAPKGMGIIDDLLYVTNIDEVITIDIVSGKIIDKMVIKNAIFLNDIVVGSNNDIFISDTGTNTIHLLSKGNLSVWLKDSTLQGANGLLVQKNNLLVASFGGGDFSSFSLASKTKTILTDSIIGGDGVVAIGKDYLVSNWYGEVYHVQNGIKTKLLDTKENKMNAADICFVEDQSLLLVPTFFGNTVVAYKVK